MFLQSFTVFKANRTVSCGEHIQGMNQRATTLIAQAELSGLLATYVMNKKIRFPFE